MVFVSSQMISMLKANFSCQQTDKFSENLLNFQEYFEFTKNSSKLSWSFWQLFPGTTSIVCCFLAFYKFIVFLNNSFIDTWAHKFIESHDKLKELLPISSFSSLESQSLIKMQIPMQTPNAFFVELFVILCFLTLLTHLHLEVCQPKACLLKLCKLKQNKLYRTKGRRDENFASLRQRTVSFRLLIK